MVVRAFLTSELIDQLEPPDKGELWIADTHQPGFGIRLWAGKSKPAALHTPSGYQRPKVSHIAARSIFGIHLACPLGNSEG